jgi:hypothetical protein
MVPKMPPQENDAPGRRTGWIFNANAFVLSIDRWSTRQRSMRLLAIFRLTVHIQTAAINFLDDGIF